MTVPARYILAAIAFGVAVLGFFLLPTEANACGANGCSPPPSCHGGCNPPRALKLSRGRSRSGEPGSAPERARAPVARAAGC